MALPFRCSLLKEVIFFTFLSNCGHVFVPMLPSSPGDPLLRHQSPFRMFFSIGCPSNESKLRLGGLFTMALSFCALSDGDVRSVMLRCCRRW